MAYSPFSIDAFRANLINGGARNNLYIVSGSFPGGGSAAINAVAGVAGAIGGGAAAALASNVAAVAGNGNPNAQVQFLCKATKLPASDIGEIKANYMGREFKYAGDRTFADWSVTVYNDGTYGLHKAFINWQNLINTNASNVGPNANAGYLQDWFVTPVTREGNPIITYKMVGCWPKTVGEVALAFDPNPAISETPVTLSYQYHEVVGITT
jgi:hypothetical protein